MIYRQSGAEKTLIMKLREKGINVLHSIGEVEDHLKNSEQRIHALRSKRIQKLNEEIEEREHTHRIMLDERQKQRIARRDSLLKEKECLLIELPTLNRETRNPILWLRLKIRKRIVAKRLHELENKFMEALDQSFHRITSEIVKLENQLEYAKKNFDHIIENRMHTDMILKHKIDNAIGGLSSWLAGARGEIKTITFLRQLPESYKIVNDVHLRFEHPIRTDSGMRFSCQMDHVVVGPTGVLNLESKNWSQQSIESLDLRSPVEQIRTAGKALWIAINKGIENRQIRVNRHHWGTKKVNVRNVLAMSGAMPKEEFQFVKMLSTSRLKGYIEYFDKLLEPNEVDVIIRWILGKVERSHQSQSENEYDC